MVNRAINQSASFVESQLLVEDRCFLERGQVEAFECLRHATRQERQQSARIHFVSVAGKGGILKSCFCYVFPIIFQVVYPK